jgi:hypothetical protein
LNDILNAFHYSGARYESLSIKDEEREWERRWTEEKTMDCGGSL